MIHQVVLLLVQCTAPTIEPLDESSISMKNGILEPVPSYLL